MELWPTWAAAAVAGMMQPHERERWLSNFDPSSRAAIRKEMGQPDPKPETPRVILTDSGPPMPEVEQS
jgi:hypothetical protein